MSLHMKRYFLLSIVILILALAGAAVSVSGAASQTPAPGDLPLQPEARLSPGNYCISCHMAGDPRLAGVTGWKGGIGREVNSPCPAATAVHKELYYTERMLLMIDRAGGAQALPEKMQAQLEAQIQAYSRLLEAPVTSLDAFTSEAQGIRYRLNKVYSALNQGVEASKRKNILYIAIAASLVVLGSLVWGWLNTRRFTGGVKRKPNSLLAAGVFLLAVTGLFTLPLFRLPPAVTVATTVEQQEAQAVMDEADRAVSSADRAQARAWMLARLALADPDHAAPILKEAEAAFQEARANESALWGESLAVQEANVVPSIQMEKARLIAVDLNAARTRQWSLPLIAVEWAKVDGTAAASLLDAEEGSLAVGNSPYRDLQLRAVALAWAQIQPERALPSAARISAADIRSWTEREIWMLTKDPVAFAGAKGAAREIEDPIQRARALRELAVVTGEEALFDEALAALEEVTGESQAYAISDLAAASGDASLVEMIGQESLEARAYMLLSGDDEQAAYQASLVIADPVERARAQAAAAGAWANAEAAMQIEMEPYRDLALRDVILKTGNVSLMHNINSVYYKVEVLAALGETSAALEEAGGLKDSFPLVRLGILLAKEDPQSARELLESMAREVDKAAVLKVLAAQGGDPALFEQALGMALAARVRGDALAPAQASLDLAEALWSNQPGNARTALGQALEAARRITIR